MKALKYIILYLLFIACLGSGCKKYLDEIPDKKLAVPNSVDEIQMLLDNYDTMNTNFPNALEIQGDNYFVSTATWLGLSDERLRHQYLWQKGESVNWNNLYKPIYNANVALDQLEVIVNKNQLDQNIFNNVKGNAQFFRSYYLYLCAQLYGQPYDKNSAGIDLGVVLRLNSDFNEPSKRATVQATYNEIINGFEQAIKLLPVKQAIKTRPSKSAGYGALARTYLTMQEYEKAGKYADSCIKLYGSDSLLNFNNSMDAVPSASVPFKIFNKEVVFHLIGNGGTIFSSSRARVDSTLYKSYSPNDLRKTSYFKANTGANLGTYIFKGGYDGLGGSVPNIFGGIALDEMYLIRAEAYARERNTPLAMRDLNRLLINRWVSGTFVPYQISNPQEALLLILEERRKELVYRGTRWADLRRLMKEPSLAVKPKRIIDNVNYELLPNSPRYTLLIPATVINLTGIPQNQ